MAALNAPGPKDDMRKKILVVEDNSELLELLSLGLEQAGFSVAAASNGIEALKAAREIAPNLILLDLVLPELDGFEVCASLQRDAVLASIPVIILTGLSSEFARFAGLECGAVEYVMKPINLERLVSKVRRLLSQPMAGRTRGQAGNPGHGRASRRAGIC